MSASPERVAAGRIRLADAGDLGGHDLLAGVAPDGRGADVVEHRWGELSEVAAADGEDSSRSRSPLGSLGSGPRSSAPRRSRLLDVLPANANSLVAAFSRVRHLHRAARSSTAEQQFRRFAFEIGGCRLRPNRLHAAIGYVTPTTNTQAADRRSAAPAPPACAEREPSGSSTIDYSRFGNPRSGPEDYAELAV
jgi:hypothetical protein